jgi:hypothetical protein
MRGFLKIFEKGFGGIKTARIFAIHLRTMEA